MALFEPVPGPQRVGEIVPSAIASLVSYATRVKARLERERLPRDKKNSRQFLLPFPPPPNKPDLSL